MTSMILGVCKTGCQSHIHFWLLTIETVVQIACQCSGDRSSGTFCAYFQTDGASGTLQTASDFVADLQKHNCVNCGSVTTQGKSDISAGGLAVNFVGTSDCCAGQGETYLICPASTTPTSSRPAPPPASIPHLILRSPPSPRSPPFPLSPPPSLTKRSSLSTNPAAPGSCDNLDQIYPDPPAASPSPGSPGSPPGRTSIDWDATF